MSRVIEGTNNSASHSEGQILLLYRFPITREVRRTYSMNTKTLCDLAFCVFVKHSSTQLPTLWVLSVSNYKISIPVAASKVTIYLGLSLILSYR